MEKDKNRYFYNNSLRRTEDDSESNQNTEENSSTDVLPAPRQPKTVTNKYENDINDNEIKEDNKYEAKSHNVSDFKSSRIGPRLRGSRGNDIRQRMERIENRNKFNSNRNSFRYHSGDKSQYTLVDVLMQKFISRAKYTTNMHEQPGQLVLGNKWDNLNVEIWHTFISAAQSMDIYVKKINLWRNLYIYTRKVYPHYGLFLVGSTMSGFGTNNSDLDICLLVRKTHVDQRTEAVEILEQVKKVLNGYGVLGQTAEVICAKVPILKFNDCKNELDVDVNCNNSVGIRNTHLLHCYANLDWRVRPLVIMIKLWAQHHNINDAKRMTISSYSLVLMTIHFLQSGVSPPVLPCLHHLYPNKFNSEIDIHSIDMDEQLSAYFSDNSQSLGELLIGFFHYYAKFNFLRDAISVRLGSRINVEDCKNLRTKRNVPYEWKYLCVEEPFELTNTARAVYDGDVFQNILTLLSKTLTKLRIKPALSSLFHEDNLSD